MSQASQFGWTDQEAFERYQQSLRAEEAAAVHARDEAIAEAVHAVTEDAAEEIVSLRHENESLNRDLESIRSAVAKLAKARRRLNNCVLAWEANMRATDYHKRTWPLLEARENAKADVLAAVDALLPLVGES